MRLMRGIHRAIVPALLAALIACGGADPVAAVPLGSLRGSVTDAEGAAMANVPVTLAASGQYPRITQTGGDGVYVFAEVPPGNYLLTVSPPEGFALADAPATVAVAVTRDAQTAAPPFVLSESTTDVGTPTPPSELSPAAKDSAFIAGLTSHLSSKAATGAFSGAVLVLRDSDTLFKGAYGLADREANIPNTLDTKFRVGSMYKMLTAVATLQLVQAGTLNLNAPIGTYLTDYPNATLAAAVTPHHLLTHTGGTGDIFGPLFNINRLELREASDYIALYGDRAVQYTPGSQHVYSNYGFVLLGALIERLSGKSYHSYIGSHVLTPAGMTATGTAPEDVNVPLRSVGYTATLSPGSLVSNASTLPYRGTAAGGGYSTVGDMARFVAAVRQHQLLTPVYTNLLHTGKVSVNPAVQYAYGFVDKVVGTRRWVGHSGGAAGMNGDLAFQPSGGYTVVVLANLDSPSATSVSGFILATLP